MALYAAPLPTVLLADPAREMIGDGTDMTTLPFHYGLLQRTFAEHPSWLLYGSVYTEEIDPPVGFGLWIPWCERLFVLLFGGVFSLEKLPTAFALLLFALDAALFYLFGRCMGWSRAISATLAMCWAFNPFTRARAGVHLALAGTFFLPAVVAALVLLRRHVPAGAPTSLWREPAVRKPLLAAAALLVVAASAAHYYLITLGVMMPLFALVLFSVPDVRARARQLALAAALAALPAVLLVGWNRAYPVPPEVAARAQQSFVPPPVQSEAFLRAFGAHPTDFLTSDIRFSREDWNPLREALNERTFQNIERKGGNEQERSNGIRWSLLALVVAAVALFGAGTRTSKEERRLFAVFLGLGAVGGAFALSSDFVPFSTWVHRLVANFRVPSRFGPYAHFGILACAGIVMTEIGRRGYFPRLTGARRLVAAHALLLAIVLEYWPSHPLPLQTLQESRAALAEGRADCGVGLFFPYIAAGGAFDIAVPYYHLQQSLRGTGCKLLNRNGSPGDDAGLRRAFDLAALQRGAESNPMEMLGRLRDFAHCAGLSWLVFADGLPPIWAQYTCEQLGWEQLPGNQCRSREAPTAALSAARLAQCQQSL